LNRDIGTARIFQSRGVQRAALPASHFPVARDISFTEAVPVAMRLFHTQSLIL